MRREHPNSEKAEDGGSDDSRAAAQKPKNHMKLCTGGGNSYESALIQAVEKLLVVELLDEAHVDVIFGLRRFEFGILRRELVEDRLHARERRIGFVGNRL